MALSFDFVNILLVSSYLYLRYATFQYESLSRIEIFDESQEREMAIFELTVFNRSMINLENEINVPVHIYCTEVVKSLNSNILFYTIGNIKTSKDQKILGLKITISNSRYTHLVEIQLSFDIEISKGNLIIKEIYTDGSHGPENGWFINQE